MNHKSIEIEYDLSDCNSEAFNEIEIGKIKLNTGKIVARGVENGFATPFSRTVEPGEYPVKLYVHEISPNQYIVEYAKIKFRDEKANRCLYAITEEMDLEEVKNFKKETLLGGYITTSGFSCFIDEEAETLFDEKKSNFFKEQKRSKKNYLEKVVLPEAITISSDAKELEKQVKWGEFKIDDANNQNMILFFSGWGHGNYPVFWGYNDKNDTVELTIDFLIRDTYWNHHEDE